MEQPRVEKIIWDEVNGYWIDNLDNIYNSPFEIVTRNREYFKDKETFYILSQWEAEPPKRINFNDNLDWELVY